MHHRIFLDDIREAPGGWHRTKTAKETIDLLAKYDSPVDEISLDFDLAASGPEAGSGGDVLRWILCQGKDGNWDHVPTVIHLHTGSVEGAIVMTNMKAELHMVRKQFKASHAKT